MCDFKPFSAALLVVEANPFNDESWLTDNGAFRSDQLTVTERLKPEACRGHPAVPGGGDGPQGVDRAMDGHPRGEADRRGSGGGDAVHRQGSQPRHRTQHNNPR